MDLERAAAGADVVIEAAPEQLELKRALFARIDGAAPPRALLATNTSSLSVDRIAEATLHPGRVAGMHFFNPVHLMPLVEIVRGSRSDDATIERAVALGRRLGKEPIVVRDSPGFASSRLGVVLGLEAMRMLEQGGLPVLTDGVRRADEDNPQGYYEFEAVKRTKDDPSWLATAQGKAVKLVYMLLYDLPPQYSYRVVFMRRKGWL